MDESPVSETEDVEAARRGPDAGGVAEGKTGARGVKGSRGEFARDGLWVASGQAVSAVAAIVAVRVLTEVTDPALFGSFVLANGLIGLASAASLQPGAQAGLRFFPDFEARRAVPSLVSHLVSLFRRTWLWVSASVFVLAIVDVSLWTDGGFGIDTWALIAASVWLEGLKTIVVIVWNASRRQRAYATVLAVDSLARPAGAVAAVIAVGPSLPAMLAGQALGALCVAGIGFLRMRRVVGYSESPVQAELSSRMGAFARPLFLLPVLAWAAGQSDRYVLGGVMGVSAAGLYAAAYGLASRPLLMWGEIAEATLRQPLYKSFLDGRWAEAAGIVRLWLGLNLIGGLLFAGALWAFGGEIVRLLLAEEYHATAVGVLPLVAIAYVFFLLAQVGEKVLYARGHSGKATGARFLGACLVTTGSLLGAQVGGIVGAAAGVVIAFALQAAVFAVLASRDA